MTHSEMKGSVTHIPVLKTEGLYKHFGALEVCGDINLSLAAGARHALIGPNGAGKTTLINLLTGHLKPSSGKIFLNGRDVTSLSSDRRVRLGLARTFQINALLQGLTVLENVQLAILEHRKRGSAFFFRTAAAQREAAGAAYDLLERFNLAENALNPVVQLPYGRQRLIEVAMALALEPAVLLLDEPAAGVPPVDSHHMLELIASLPDSIALLIVEHDMKLVFRFAKKISVLVQGRLLREGTPEEIAGDPVVRDVYLGHRTYA